MELNQRAIKGDAETQRFLEGETQQWINSLYQLTKDETIALSLFYIFQAAILDFLTTGNAEQGYQTIQAFTDKL
ncbi:MAG: hypothetical protein SWJ54_02740 [Cyanobacteriota bacterium]|nr:hypothetical protein [Cyanobacteriota bacterium]